MIYGPGSIIPGAAAIDVAGERDAVLATGVINGIGSIEGNRGSVDPENMNFQLKDDSPVYKLGFQRIPIEKIGLYKDELRALWPKVGKENVVQ